ncbi:hypothetical protein BG006_003852 [Podila minutissima]|uniref:DUF7905 domain-containing protein n=1 Tax=Podila minutissima TaxID=64525 RepID=A0A9P5SRF3_9FUNG|nr:hypothetical protein BG006_003852 [Podila minutissima]
MDHDDETAKEWQINSSEDATDVNATTECDDYWFIPLYTNVEHLKRELEKIGSGSGTHLRYNASLERIDIWGGSIPKAKASLDRFSQHYFNMEQNRQRATRARGWARPQRELTPAEKKKAERKERQQKEQEKYLGVPKDVLPFQHCLLCPKDVPIFRLLGGNLQNLDKLRAEFKSFIWIERDTMKLWAAGEHELDVLTAINRIKNFCLRFLNRPQTYCYHILEKPSRPAEVHLVPYDLAKYVRPRSVRHERNPILYMKAKLLEGYESLADIDNHLAESKESREGPSSHWATAAIPVERNVKSIKYFESMQTSNKDKIRRYLRESLEQIQLMDYEIKMRIRLGQIGLKEYPKKTVWSIDELDDKVIPVKKLVSEFNQYITRSANGLAKFMEALGPNNEVEAEHIQWSLGILKKGDNEVIKGELEVSFRDDGKLALWNGLVERTKPLEIKVICSERKYSWAWDISVARRLPLDKFSPEGVFVHLLTLERRPGYESRMVFSNTPDVQLKRVLREKRTLFTRAPWTIEVVEETFWILPEAYRPSLAITLNREPDDVLYTVSMYRDSWPSRFSENPFLGVGQAPFWSPEDFLSEQESLESTLEFVSWVQDQLESSMS